MWTAQPFALITGSLSDTKDSMRKIYKYDLPVMDVAEVSLPAGAEILKIEAQRGMACLWALIDDLQRPEKRTFLIVGTGNPVPDEATKETHVATFQQGPFVWHVFEPRK